MKKGRKPEETNKNKRYLRQSSCSTNISRLVGGAEAVQKITSRVQKGDHSRPFRRGQHFPAEVYSKAPGQALFQ